MNTNLCTTLTNRTIHEATSASHLRQYLSAVLKFNQQMMTALI